jgi:hypothetical protein
LFHAKCHLLGLSKPRPVMGNDEIELTEKQTKAHLFCSCKTCAVFLSTRIKVSYMSLARILLARAVLWHLGACYHLCGTWQLERRGTVAMASDEGGCLFLDLVHFESNCASGNCTLNL